MGLSIPDSPSSQDAGSQWTGPTLAPSRSGLREGFRQSIAARRRNAIVPGSLSFDAMGSPRSPHVFLTQEHRRALALGEHQQGQLPMTSQTQSMQDNQAAWSATDIP